MYCILKFHTFSFVVWIKIDFVLGTHRTRSHILCAEFAALRGNARVHTLAAETGKWPQLLIRFTLVKKKEIIWTSCACF